MTTPSHTPGPWHIGVKPGPFIYGPQGEEVADMRGDTLASGEARANRDLIVAAPDMLAALLAAQATVETHTVRAYKYGCVDRDAEATLAEISAAIAKATGTPV